MSKKLSNILLFMCKARSYKQTSAIPRKLRGSYFAVYRPRLFVSSGFRGQKSSSEVESKFKRPVCTPSNESGSVSNNKPGKSRHHFLTCNNATEEQRNNSENFVGDSILSQLIPEMVNTGVPPHSVREDKKFVSHVRRSVKTVVEPYIPRRKSSCYSLLSRDNACNKECIPVDLEQSYKELTDHEEKFVIDIMLNKC